MGLDLETIEVACAALKRDHGLAFHVPPRPEAIARRAKISVQETYAAITALEIELHRKGSAPIFHELLMMLDCYTQCPDMRADENKRRTRVA
jgi:hypothetical protein